MRAMFYKNGCRYCHREKFGVIMANLRLPVGRMINFIDIESGDPRANVVDDIFDRRFAPVIVLDNERVFKFGNSYIKGLTRHAIASSFGNNTINSLIKGLLWDEVI